VAENELHLRETCQAAITLLPCGLAWLLTVESDGLRSQVIVTEKGDSASEVFLRLYTGGTHEHPLLPMQKGANPISDAALNPTPTVNLNAQSLASMPGAANLFRAVTGLRYSVVHFLPLVSASQPTPIGLLILASPNEHDVSSRRGTQILEALASQSTAMVENVRLVANLAAREQQMRVEQAFRKMVLDTMGDSLLVVDEDARIRYANNRMLNTSGYTRKELYGQSVGMIFHPDTRDVLVLAFKPGSRKTMDFSQRMVTKDGRVVHVLMSRSTVAATDTSGQSTVIVLSDLTEQKRREEALERQGERLRLINRAVQAFTSSLTLEDVLHQIIQTAAEVIGAENGILVLQDVEDLDLYRVAVTLGDAAARLPTDTVRTGSGIAGQVAYDRTPYLTSKVDGDNPFELPNWSVLAVPLIVVDRIIGVLEVIHPNGKPFLRDDVEIMENIAVSASVAIEKARLFDQTHRRVNELSTLLEASSAASSTLDISSVLELTTRRLREALGVSRCSIATWDKNTDRLIVLAEACNSYWPPNEGPERPLGALLFSTGVLNAGSRALLGRLAEPKLDGRIRLQLTRARMSSVMVLPLRFGGVNVGLVELFKSQTQQNFTALHLQAVEDLVRTWHERINNNPNLNVLNIDSLTELSMDLTEAARASWCILSLWDRMGRKARAIREIGFAVWGEQSGVSYSLNEYSTMANSLKHGMPMTFYSAMLGNDPKEQNVMRQFGANTGLVTPLLVRGEASGLVKLLDTAPDRNFDLAEVSLCIGIGNVIGNALENSKLYQSLERRANMLQAAYDELREADRLKDNLIQSLSHELKTPLHKMSMQLELLAMEALGTLNEEQRDSMKSMITWSTQLAALVNNMVSLHSVRGKPIEFAPVRIDVALAQAVESVRKRVPDFKHKIIFNLEPGLPPLRADQSKLSDVFDQLIDNAIKFSPESDRVEISAWDAGEPTIHICVQDFGIGIPSSEFDRIFQSGYQIDGGLTRRYGGTGIGLAIVRSLIEAHGGKIWVESVPNHGSKFNITIPRWTGQDALEAKTEHLSA